MVGRRTNKTETKTIDEIKKGIPESVIHKMAGSAQKRPYHADIVYAAKVTEHRYNTVNSFKELLNNDQGISTSWRTVKNRCDDLEECGIFEKRATDKAYYLSEWAIVEFKQSDIELESDSWIAQWESDHPVGSEERPHSEKGDSKQSDQLTRVEMVLQSDQEEIFLLGVAMAIIGSLFAAAGIVLIGEGLWVSSGEKIATVGGLGVLVGAFFIGLALYRVLLSERIG